jgi:two-component system, NarL family, sensor histidine kinase UhpB
MSDDRGPPRSAPRNLLVERGVCRRWQQMSLLWRVFASNAAVLVGAIALLAWTPVTIKRVATLGELLILTAGLVVMLVVDMILLRRALGPLRRLAGVMGGVDPSAPGRRAPTAKRAGREVVSLAESLNAMLDRLEDERRESSRRALAAQEGERARIARELHDEVGQTLTAVALRAERAAGGQAERQGEALTGIAEIVLRSLDDLHRIGRELRPEALDDLGLVNALLALCSRVAAQNGLDVRPQLSWAVPTLSRERELVVYRVAQEALTNAVRHSQGTVATVSLKPAQGAVVLMVADDGRGLPVVRIERGLAGMRERALLIDAKLEVGPSVRGGTTVTLSVPSQEQR